MLPPPLDKGEIPLLDFSAIANLIQAEKPNHLSHLELTAGENGRLCL